MPIKIGSPAWKRIVTEGAGELGVNVSAKACDLFGIHARHMARWNRTHNLTAIHDTLEVAVKHYLDSIVASPAIPERAALLDIGSGAGFPGVPLKIIQPELTVTLIDASRKRVSFLRHAIRVLGLQGIEARQMRLQAADARPTRKCVNGTLGQDAPRASGSWRLRKFDVVISRALSPMGELVKLACPLIVSGGVLVAFGTDAGTAEKQAGEAAGWMNGRRRDGPPVQYRVRPYRLPFLNIDRCLVTLHVPATGGRAEL